MLAQALERGADGVLGMRYSTNQVQDGITEVLAYGTAVSRVPAFTSAATDTSPAAQAFAEAEGPLPPHMVTTSNVLPEFTAQANMGVVQGLAVRSTHIFANIGAGLKSIVGGEIKAWSRLCLEARGKAYTRMLEEAGRHGAKGVVGMRYDSNEVAPGIVEVIAYGTMVSDVVPTAAVPLTEPSQLMRWLTTDVTLPGHATSRTLGTVQGISVRSIHCIRSLGASLKTVVGGEIRNYTAMCARAREQAHTRLLEQAFAKGATGIVAMRYESNQVAPGIIEIVAYGTAVTDGSRAAPVEAAAASGTLSDTHVSTTNDLVGSAEFARSLGLVRGLTVRSRNVVSNIGGSLKATFWGGEVKTWTTLCESARAEAFQRLLAEAEQRGAIGIIGMRYETNEIAEGITEVLAYGTAVAA
jgi:uncharacterized protein YbjQ (UPF0145 family)